jgi:hypothetical protein
MKSNLISRRTNIKLSSVNILSIQFSRIPQFIQKSCKESKITRLLSLRVYVGSHHVTIAWMRKDEKGNGYQSDINQHSLTAEIRTQDLPNIK